MNSLTNIILENKIEEVENVNNLKNRLELDITHRFVGKKLQISKTLPLHFCVYLGRLEIGEILIKNGAKIDILDTGFKWAPLHYSSFCNDIEFSELLLKKGAKVDVLGEIEETPFQIAINNKYLKLANLFLQYGANINHQNNHGATALHIAVTNKDINIITFLIQKGADPNLLLDNEKTSFQIAEKSNRLDILDILKGKSTMLSFSIEQLFEGYSDVRYDDIDEPSSLVLPDNTKVDPNTRYKDPQKVLKQLGINSFDEASNNISPELLQHIHLKTLEKQQSVKKEEEKKKNRI